MATVGLSKVFILDKYFTELQRYWETEKKLTETNRTGSSANFDNGDKRITEAQLDLIYLQGPLTEDLIVRTLATRFHENEFLVSLLGTKFESICFYLAFLNFISSTASLSLFPKLTITIWQHVVKIYINFSDY